MTETDKAAADKAAADKAAADKAAADKAAAELAAKTYTHAEYVAMKTKLDESRASNIALLKEQTETKTKYEDIDLENYAKMTKAAKEAKDKKMIDAGQVDELVASKVKDIQTKNAAEAVKTAKINSTLNSQLEVLIVDNAVRSASTLEGVVDTGINDMILRSKSVFKVVDGKAVAYDKAGTEIYKTGTVTPITVQEWVKDQAGVAPHLFKASVGVGAKHLNGGLTPDDVSKLSSTQKIEKGLEAEATP
jgi:hypothetical protein